MRYLSTIAVAALVSFATGPSPAQAQNAAPGSVLGTARAAIASHAAVDTFVALVPARQMDQIDADLATSRELEREGEAQKARAARMRDHVLASREVQVKEIERLEAAIVIAEQLDEGSRKEALERERELRERYRDLLAEQGEARALAIELAQRRTRHARAMRARLQQERRLAQDRIDWRALQGVETLGEDASRRRDELSKSIQERLKKYFEARREEVRELENVARAERELIEKQLEVVERRRNLFED